MHRAVAFVAILCSCLMSGVGIAVAQQATPDNAAFSGMPELTVTITDDAVQVDKTEIPDGYVLMNVVNNSKDNNSAGVLGPGPGRTMDDLKAAAATPEASDEIPPFLYEATVLGGPGDIDPGKSAQAVINVPAGDWAVFAEGSQPPVFISAKQTADSSTRPPTADTKIELGDFYFNGFSEGVKPGPQVWEVTNTGKQIHMMVVGKVPDGTTEQQVIDTFTAQETGTPVAGALQESDLQPAGTGVLLISSGQTMYVTADLEAGTYVALCFVTDPQTHKLHAMEGMVSVFQVGQGTATPTS
jgi:hypothetical protein